MNQGVVFFYSWPGEIKSVAGGTRTEVKLSRPWQKEIVVDPDTCPFCTTDRDYYLHYFKEQGGWYLRENRFTPFPFHRLVVASSCWSPQQLRTLGGLEKIEAALEKSFNEVRHNPGSTVRIDVFVGSLAGQNLAHLHYHTAQYFPDEQQNVRSRLLAFYALRPDLVLAEDGIFLVGVGGIRAGQCFILPKSRPTIGKLARIIDHIVTLYNEGFLSSQGLAPDFGISLNFRDTIFQYGLYVPTLNQLGSGEYLALHEGACVALPWPHEATVKHLKS